MNSLLIAPGLPGGMMGSLMADLESNLESINKYKAKHNLPFMTQDQLLIKLFDEVAYVGPMVSWRLSSIGDSVQPIREEPRHDECDGYGKKEKERWGNDCR